MSESYWDTEYESTLSRNEIFSLEQSHDSSAEKKSEASDFSALMRTTSTESREHESLCEIELADEQIWNQPAHLDYSEDFQITNSILLKKFGRTTQDSYCDLCSANEETFSSKRRNMKNKNQAKILENEFIKEREWSKEKIIKLSKLLRLS